MTPGQQTFAALGIVALAAVWMLWRVFSRSRTRGCGGGDCHAISPEVKKLKKKLRR
jgi:ABC-type nickel/cobalt efflux system permease component RcnA